MPGNRGLIQTRMETVRQRWSRDIGDSSRNVGGLVVWTNG